MTADILAEIEDTLSDWEGSRDSACWQPSALPPLNEWQKTGVRIISDRTGMDGYAAWLAVADVATFGSASPYWDLWELTLRDDELRPAGHAQAVTMTVTVDVGGMVEALRRFGAAMDTLATACGISAKQAEVFAHGLAHIRRVPRCRLCNPAGNPPKLSVDGREYHRRQLARRRRGRR